MVKLAFIIGYGASALPLLSKILSAESNEHKFEFVVTSDERAQDHLEFLRASDAIFIYLHNLAQEVEGAIAKSRASIVISASESYGHLSRGQRGSIARAVALFKLGGERNLSQLVHLLLRESGLNVEVAEPEEIPWHGIWHPELGTFTDVDEYLEKYAYSNKPLVGLLFYRTYWLYGNRDDLKSLIKSLENEGLGVIPVFTYGFKDANLGTPSAEDSIREFFISNGKPLIQALINLTSFFLLDRKTTEKDFFASKAFNAMEGVELLKGLNVPIIQAVRSYYRSVEEWRRDPAGVDYMTQVYHVIMPEVDGLIEPIFSAGSKVSPDGVKIYEAFEEHSKHIAKRVRRWIELRSKPPRERRVAIILINPPCKGLEANVGVGLGLDVPESVARLLHAMREFGYDVGDGLPRDGRELIKMIMERRAISEFRWTSVEDIVKSGGAIDFVSLDEYSSWFNELPEDLRERIVNDWGRPEDVLAGKVDKALVGMVYDGKFVIPGIRFGNIFITPQPKFGCAGARCDGVVCRILHDPTITPPHQWWAVYRWITRKFKADLIIHFGTHGYLEFRPGKGVGLSPSCVPEASLDDVPHLYVYAVSNPMEGVIAKRRGYATLVDHIYPPMAMAEVLDELDSLLTQYAKAKSLGDELRRRKVYEQMLEKAKERRIRVRDPKDEEGTIEEVHRYVDLMRGSQINLGLHIFGHPPKEPRRLAEYVITAMSYDSYYSPSIMRAMAEAVGLDYDKMRKDPMGTTNGFANRELLEALHKVAVKSLESLLNGGGLELEELGKFELEVKDRGKLDRAFGKAVEVAEKIAECGKEYGGFFNGLEGGYVEPGASGAITRGKFEILPTGRNFYAVNPMALPSKAAWQVGVETAEKLLKKYKEEHGKYPESVGQVLWSIDAYKADGEQIAQILYLIGVRPIWNGDVVSGLEVIPLEELGRPRVDVLVRISGIVRDTLPNYIHWIDEAVEKVVVLDEPLEMNYVRKHYIENIKRLVELGRKFDEARRFAKFRVFSEPPGAYGAGVNYAVEASAWEKDEDLAKTWVQWSGYAYGKDAFGVEAHEAFVLNLKNVDAINRNHVSDEHDITGCCCYFSYHGGFKTAVDALTGKNVDIIQTDTRDISDTKVVDMKDEIERVARAKLLNERWIEEMKKHGYRGANEFSRKILHLYGWEATTKLVEDWVFDEIARKYVLDEEMRRWFEENNLYALEEIARRLIEAYERGLWRTDEELIERLKEVYSQIEGILEEEIGAGEVQGGSIDVFTAKDDEHWGERIKRVEELWGKVRGPARSA